MVMFLLITIMVAASAVSAAPDCCTKCLEAKLGCLVKCRKALQAHCEADCGASEANCTRSICGAGVRCPEPVPRCCSGCAYENSDCITNCRWSQETMGLLPVERNKQMTICRFSCRLRQDPCTRLTCEPGVGCPLNVPTPDPKECCSNCSDARIACLQKYQKGVGLGSLLLRDLEHHEMKCRTEEADCTDSRCGAGARCLVSAPERECCASCKMVYTVCAESCTVFSKDSGVVCTLVCKRQLTICLNDQSQCYTCARDPDQGLNNCYETCDTTTRLCGSVSRSDICNAYRDQCRIECGR